MIDKLQILECFVIPSRESIMFPVCVSLGLQVTCVRILARVKWMQMECIGLEVESVSNL